MPEIGISPESAKQALSDALPGMVDKVTDQESSLAEDLLQNMGGVGSLRFLRGIYPFNTFFSFARGRVFSRSLFSIQPRLAWFTPYCMKSRLIVSCASVFMQSPTPSSFAALA